MQLIFDIVRKKINSARYGGRKLNKNKNQLNFHPTIDKGRSKIREERK